MAWFKAFRSEHGFTSYPDNHSRAAVDFPLLIVCYFCVLVAIATLIATLGIRGKQKWSSAIRASYAVAIGSIILVCNFSHSWQEGRVNVVSPYLYRSNLHFSGNVGVYMALHGANITLDGYFKSPHLKGEVHFKESILWPDFGKGKDCFDSFLQRGLPDPILKVVEFLTYDEGGLRWGRSYQKAGHFANILLWTAFAFWVVSNVLLFSVIVYGAYMFFLTGVAMVAAGVTYHCCLNDQPMEIIFEDTTLYLDYGWCFWLNIAAGLVTIILGLVLIIFDKFAQRYVNEFFDLEKNDEDHYDTINALARNFNLDDRRGSVFKGTQYSERHSSGSMRRGSIFLEPERRPSWFSDNIRRNFSFPNTGNGAINKGFESDSFSKENPIYDSDGNLKNMKGESRTDDAIRMEMERVCCADSDICLSSRKPSLATLKEHRENHDNERRSSSASCPTRPTNYLRQCSARSCSMSSPTSFCTLEEDNEVSNIPETLVTQTSTSFIPSDQEDDLSGRDSGYSAQRASSCEDHIEVCIEPSTVKSQLDSNGKHVTSISCPSIQSRSQESEDEGVFQNNEESSSTSSDQDSLRYKKDIILNIDNS